MGASFIDWADLSGLDKVVAIYGVGNNVVIDYGLWGRDERSALRQAAADLDE